MPRAKLSEERARRASAQLVAATQVQTAAAIEAVEVQVETVASTVPPDLVTELDTIRDRLDALEP